MKTLLYGLVVASACLLVSGCETSDLTKTYTGSGTMVVPAKSGQKTVLTNIFKANDDCSSALTPTLSVVEGPAHGRLSIVRSTVSPTFEPGNKLFKCNARKISSISPVYVSAPGFVGQDSVRISGHVAGNPAEFKDYFEFRINVMK